MRNRRQTRSLLAGAVLVAALALLIGAAHAADPVWWTSRKVVDPTRHKADYAPALLGQLKWFATNACDELEAYLPAGAGPSVWDVVRGFNNASNYCPANIGQLKFVAKPFYDRLVVGDYPWTATAADDADSAIATIGQVKRVFSFDVRMDSDSDSMPDWWEIHWFTNLIQSATDDFDLDGLNNSNEYVLITCPASVDSDGDGASDGLEVNAGTDPLNTNSYPADIAGTIIYSGGQTGRVWVIAVTNSGSWSTNHCHILNAPGSYAITNLPNLATYWMKSWRDSDGDNSNDLWEAQGAASNNPIYLGTNLCSVNIDLTDLDTDGDGMPDWWEIQHGFKPEDSSDATCDTDGDRFPNIYEYEYSSDPANSASVPQSNAFIFVSLSGSHIPPFTNWATASTNIQAAIDQATNDYDIVFVADGIYTGACNRNLNFYDRKIMLMSANGSDNCVIDCQTNGRAVYCPTNTHDRMVIDGLTSRNGKTASDGGACYMGGTGTPTIQNCTIANNSALGDGGAMFGSALIRNCTIIGNSAGGMGGGICHRGGTSSVENCYLINNSAPAGGGGICCSTGELAVANSTVVFNYGGGSGGGICLHGGVLTNLQNTILWFNSSNQLSGVMTSSVSYCDIQDWTNGGPGNITTDPLLTGGWRLSVGSPCVDAGGSNSLPRDFEGELRWDATNANAVSIWDIGADEFVDTNYNGMADAWEIKNFGNLTNSPTADHDGDGLANLDEYYRGASPTNTDTDGDGFADGWEVTHGGNPILRELQDTNNVLGLRVLTRFRRRY